MRFILLWFINKVGMAMNRKVVYLLVLAVGATSVAATTRAQGISDRVRLARGSESGEITATTPHEITLKGGSGGSRTIALNLVKTVVFDDEPAELSQARVKAANGAYEDAQELLAKIDSSSVNRPLIQQDIEFYNAWSAGKLALAGSAEIADAGRQLNNFVRSYPQNFHNLAAIELMGDLLMASQRYEAAEKQYAEIAKAPWPDYRMRASVAAGRSLQAQGKHAEAIAQFDAALAVNDDNADSKNQRLAATLAKAISLSETGGVDKAVGTIEKVIQDADPQERELHARAYIALGRCYAEAGKTKDALLAFLHVDVLYSNVPEAHAEALAQLVPLWASLGQEARSREAKQLLQERYANSQWAKQP
jgi:tetratricopeptide (TPR) repeat protein